MKNDIHENLSDLFIEEGGFINENLIIKYDDERGFGVFSKNNIPPNSILINVPHNLLISVNKVDDVTKFRNTFKQKYFETIISNDKQLKHHPLLSNNFELKIINKVLRNNENLNKDFSKKHKEFSELSIERKKIELLSLTRAIFIGGYNTRFFMPMMDFVNYHNEGLSYSTSKDGNVYLKSTNHIKKNEEILINYTDATDAISFFLGHGFVDDSYKSFKIKKNELNLKLNTISTFNEKYFSKENDIYTFKEDIIFNQNRFSLNINQFLEIFPQNQRKQMLVKILKIYKNSISIDVEDYNLTKDSIILKNFFKSVELYTKIIDNYLELIEKK
jgi:hypothetical protein